jgi:hypothetical protein
MCCRRWALSSGERSTVLVLAVFVDLISRGHTFASQLLALGAPISYVAAQLGHERPTTTLAYYAKWIPTEGKSFAGLLDGNPAAESQRISQQRVGRRRKVVSREGIEPSTYGLRVVLGWRLAPTIRA